ncbi:lytTr DNA-binding region [Roseburia sp. CAG:309]|nr:lytTr DNA-binding region [Roseburia sp. CAG:309]
MYRFAICDDDPQFAALLKEALISQLNNRNIAFEISFFDTPSDLISRFEQEEPYDLLFLDIVFQDTTGIQMARRLRSFHTDTDIIFLSSSSDYALESFDVSPLHYLIKTDKLEKLEEALDRFFDKHADQSFYIKSREGILSLPVSEILFFEIYGHDLSVHLISGENHTFSGTLKKIEEDLPGSTFIRAHKSYLVNMAHIVKIVRYEISLSNGKTVPISKKNYLSIMSAFVDYSTRSVEM